MAVYDRIGVTYTTTRNPDPRIDAAIRRALGAARSVVNVGAGAGSYEPRDRHVLAIEPTEDQRTIQVRQVLPGVRFAGLGTEQQALPRLVHGPILPSTGRAIGTFLRLFLPTDVKFSAGLGVLY